MTLVPPKGQFTESNVILVELVGRVEPASSASGDSSDPVDGQGQQDSSPVSSRVLRSRVTSVLREPGSEKVKFRSCPKEL